MTLSYKRDYDITENSVSITTFSHGRKTYRIQNFDYARQFFEKVIKWKLVVCI
jgi:putative transposase